jgi:hypothetical protein
MVDPLLPMLEPLLPTSSFRVNRWPHILMVMLVALVLADLSFRVRPTGYLGGSTDDQRYVEAALQWIVHGPHAGSTHWSLRHPLVLSIVVSFKAFGISLASLQLVPRLYADALVALTAGMLARNAGGRVTVLWVTIALTSPILHDMATSCFPEMVELTFGAASMWLFWEARKGGGWSGALLLGSGVALALATLTRETAVGMLVIYGVVWLRGRMPLSGAIWFAAGFVPPVAIDLLWLWSITGDPLYRLHVDQSHIGIYSDHLRGGIYHGRAFLNPDLAARWLPSGPVQVHWAIDPLLNFFADPKFGLVFAAWAVLALAYPTRATASSLTARLMPLLAAVAASSYFMVNWVLTLRPQPRYYLVAVYAATIAVALLGAGTTRTPAAQRLRGGMIGLMLLAGVIAISLSPDRERDSRIVIPWLKAHPGTIAYLAPKEAARLAFPATLGDVRSQIRSGMPPVGEIRLRFPPAPGESEANEGFAQIGSLIAPKTFPYINPPRRLTIERRLR